MVWLTLVLPGLGSKAGISAENFRFSTWSSSHCFRLLKCNFWFIKCTTTASAHGHHPTASAYLNVTSDLSNVLFPRQHMVSSHCFRLLQCNFWFIKCTTSASARGHHPTTSAYCNATSGLSNVLLPRQHVVIIPLLSLTAMQLPIYQMYYFRVSTWSSSHCFHLLKYNFWFIKCTTSASARVHHPTASACWNATSSLKNVLLTLK